MSGREEWRTLSTEILILTRMDNREELAMQPDKVQTLEEPEDLHLESTSPREVSRDCSAR